MATPIQVEKITTLEGHKDSIYSLERGPEPSLFYSAGADGMVAEWNLKEPKDGHLIAKVDNSVYALCSIPEHQLLVVGQNFAGLHIIDLKTRKERNSLALGDFSIFDI